MSLLFRPPPQSTFRIYNENEPPSVAAASLQSVRPGRSLVCRPGFNEPDPSDKENCFRPIPSTGQPLSSCRVEPVSEQAMTAEIETVEMADENDFVSCFFPSVFDVPLFSRLTK